MVIPVFAETFKINKFLPIYFLTFFAFFSKFIFLGSAGRAEPLMILIVFVDLFCLVLSKSETAMPRVGRGVTPMA